MYISIGNENCLTLEDLRNVVRETEQLPDDIPIVIAKESFNNYEDEESDIDFLNVTEIIADEESIAFYH